jgi:hypothetical protein
MLKQFVSYLYSINGVPEYAGKGQASRPLSHVLSKSKNEWSNHLRSSIKNERQITINIWPQPSEEAAFAHEKEMIACYGRRDLNTGTLYNLTDGGEGSSGLVWTEPMLERRREGHRRSYRDKPERKLQLSRTLVKHYSDVENRKALGEAVSKAKRPKHSLEMKTVYQQAIQNPLYAASTGRLNVQGTAKAFNISKKLLAIYLSGHHLDDLK